MYSGVKLCIELRRCLHVSISHFLHASSSEIELVALKVADHCESGEKKIYPQPAGGLYVSKRLSVFMNVQFGRSDTEPKGKQPAVHIQMTKFVKLSLSFADENGKRLGVYLQSGGIRLNFTLLHPCSHCA